MPTPSDGNFSGGFPLLESGWKTRATNIVGTPVVLSQGDRVDVFFQRRESGDYPIYHKSREGGTWLPSEESEGELVATASALGFCVVSREPKSFNLFCWKASSLHLWHARCDNDRWEIQKEEDLPTGANVVGTPFAVSGSPNRLDLFVVTDDGKVYHRFKENPNAAFGGWVHLGATIVGLPGITARGPNRIDVTAVGTDTRVYHKVYDNGGWVPGLSAWGRLGWVSYENKDYGVAGNMTAISNQGELLAIYCLSRDAPGGKVFSKTAGGGSWHPKDEGQWFGLGGDCADDVVSAVPGAGNEVHLAVRYPDKRVRHRYWNGTEWYPTTDWESFGGELDSPPVMCPPQVSTKDVEIFGRWSDGSLAHYQV